MTNDSMGSTNYFLGTNFNFSTVQDAAQLASNNPLNITAEDYRQIRPSELGLIGDATDSFFPSSINNSVGVFVYEDLNNPGQFALSFTAIATSQVIDTFPEILPTPPVINTDYADDFSAVYAALQNTFSVTNILATGFSLGGVAVNQLSQSFSTHFGSISAEFIAFGSELVNEAGNLLNIGASNDFLFGLYNDYADNFVANDAGLTTFPEFANVVVATQSQVGNLDPTSFLNSIFEAEPRDLGLAGTFNWYIDTGPIASNAIFTPDQFQFFNAPHNLFVLSNALEDIQNSGYADQITLESTVIFDLSDLAVNASDTNNSFINNPSIGPVFIIGENPIAGIMFDGSDVLIGHSGSDIIVGFAGDDTLIGGLGTDTLDGGEGSDTASYENSSGLAIIDLFGGPNFGVEATGDTFVSIENVTGSAFGDIIQGNQEANVINGLGGADNLTAFGGADTVNGGDGADFIQGVSGNNTINGDGGADTIFGGVDADTINGGDDGDTLFGADGNDTINGDAGNDGINAGAGNDTVDGGAGSDVIFGDAGIDMISGGDDGDTIFGGADGDVLNGNDGDDALVGEGGNDAIDGGDGLDFLSGGAGIDTLNGCLLYTSPSPRDLSTSRMPSSA